jgi:hypothetical protein
VKQDELVNCYNIMHKRLGFLFIYEIGVILQCTLHTDQARKTVISENGENEI